MIGPQTASTPTISETKGPFYFEHLAKFFFFLFFFSNLLHFLLSHLPSSSTNFERDSYARYAVYASLISDDTCNIALVQQFENIYHESSLLAQTSRPYKILAGHVPPTPPSLSMLHPQHLTQTFISINIMPRSPRPRRNQVSSRFCQCSSPPGSESRPPWAPRHT